MGGSTYDYSARSARTLSYASKSQQEIFSSRFHESMNPEKIVLRESRDSDNHPNSLAIIIGLDVTGSMGSIPENLIRHYLPKFISSLMEKGIADPQILFVAIGDHIKDIAPLQIGQFESGDAEMDLWLERVYLEGGGGGNYHESYPLAWYFAGNKTSIDCFEKRGIKGFLFTIGDEGYHENYSASSLNNIFGSGMENSEAKDWYDQVCKMYNVYHVHCRDGNHGTHPEIQWRKLLKENLITVNDSSDVFNKISNTIIDNFKKDNHMIVNSPVSNESLENDTEFKITL